jgi:hypothetical protein
MVDLLRENQLKRHDEGLATGAAAMVKKKVLFNLSHGTLLPPETTEVLCALIREELHYEIIHSELEAEFIGNEILEQIDILVLAAPTQPLNSEEVSVIDRFVKTGKSLLIATHFDSLQQDRHGINELLECFQLRAQQRVGYQHEKITNLTPHYLSAGVRRLAIHRYAACFVIAGDIPQAIAQFPGSGAAKFFLTATEFGAGRVVTIGDHTIFTDKQITKDDNQGLVCNIFRWLAHENYLDLRDASFKQHIRHGQSELFSISLFNPKSERLENIQCQLEMSNAGEVEMLSTNNCSLLPQETIELGWLITPQKLGNQHLTLKVNLPSKFAHSFILNPVAKFTCIPDADITLAVHNPHSEVPELVETGVQFQVEAVIRWNKNVEESELALSLSCCSDVLVLEKLTSRYWRVVAIEPGNYLLTLTVHETNQTIMHLVHVVLSPEAEIKTVQENLVGLFEAKVYHHLSHWFGQHELETVLPISFELLTPEAQVQKLYSHYLQEQLLDSLQVARNENEAFDALIDDLLFYIAPTYTSNHGCCIPYAPQLAARLIQKYPRREENVAYNFLSVANHSLYGSRWLEGNVMALILHEKYGHGFFYTQTVLGKQLAILYRHGLLRKVDYEQLRSPYLRALHQEYKHVIQMINHSALLVNEGFATWVELAGLQEISGSFEETAHRRKKFLFQDTQLRLLISRSEYFKRFEPGPGSKYQIMYERFRDIQFFFGGSLGFQCAIAALIKAADVDFGITEQDGRVQFGLKAAVIRDLLLEDRKGYEAGADLRLRRIWQVLQDYVRQPHHESSRTQWQKNGWQSGTLVNKIVGEKLGW